MAIKQIKMKITILFSSLSLLLFTQVHSQNPDSTSKRQVGWLIYLSDKIIFLIAENNSIKSNSSFFQDTLYENGVILSGHAKAASLIKYAHKYKVYEWKNKKSKKRVSVLAVNAQIINRSNFEPTPIEYWSFFKNNREIQLAYRFLNNYQVT
jgi:hypothetical protein